MLWLDTPTSLFSLSQTSSDIQSGDRKPALSRTDSRLLTQKRIFSLAYYFTVETSEMLSAGLSPDYLHTSLFIPTYQTAVGIISPVEFAYTFQYKLWENRDITGQPAIIYIYSVWTIMHPVYFSFQAESFCNGPETEVNCKTGLRPYIIYR
jgi:hypothetical protein